MLEGYVLAFALAIHAFKPQVFPEGSDKDRMQIQAGHLRYSGLTAWQQALQGSKAQTGAAQSAAPGTGLRVRDDAKADASTEEFQSSLSANFAASQSAAATGAAPNASALSITPTRPENTSDVFAALIGRQAVPDGSSENADGSSKDASSLIDSLSGAMEFIRDKFGDDAATASMGMVVKATSGGVNEQSLSDGLVDVLQFVENTYGQQATNSVMAKFNGSLNDELNAFFDNGSVEKFLAVENGQTFTPGDAELNAAAQGTVISSLANASASSAAGSADTASSFDDLLSKPLEELREDLDESAPTQDVVATGGPEADTALDAATTASSTARIDPALLAEFTARTTPDDAASSFARNPYDALLAGQYAAKGQLLNLSA